jgi:hypothetical protein
MEEYDKARLSGGRVVRKGFNVVKFDAIAEGTEAVIETVGMSIEVPKFVSSYSRVRLILSRAG